MRCPDGTHCPDLTTCCARGPGRRPDFDCCPLGSAAVCCPNFKSCCPARHVCTTVPPFVCIPLRYSSILRVQAIPLVNSTVKRCRDGTAGMAQKVSKSIPSQQAETASKISGFIGTSGNVFSPDGNYQCLHGTSICELSSGIYGCCHLVRGYVNFLQENSCFLGFGKLYFYYQQLNVFSCVYWFVWIYENDAKDFGP